MRVTEAWAKSQLGLNRAAVRRLPSQQEFREQTGRAWVGYDGDVRTYALADVKRVARDE